MFAHWLFTALKERSYERGLSALRGVLCGGLAVGFGAPLVVQVLLFVYQQVMYLLLGLLVESPPFSIE